MAENFTEVKVLPDNFAYYVKVQVLPEKFT